MSFTDNCSLRKLFWRGIFLAIIALLFVPIHFSQTESVITGKVTSANKPVRDAVVRWQAEEKYVKTDDNGNFNIDFKGEQTSYLLTAWKQGYYNGGVEFKQDSRLVEIELVPLPEQDNPDYEWVDPVPNPDDDIKNCGDCHASLIYKQWSNNGHANSAINELFLSIYNGTDFEGNEAVQPGYKIDYPHSNGNCSNCHAPTVAVDNYIGVDMNILKGVDKLGVSCDFCHKVKDVVLKENTSAFTGVMNMEVMRPPKDHQIFFGPFTDVPDPDVYSDKISKSIFCAPCHQGGYWGVPVYESYTEWLASPYSEEGIECQDCHMTPDGKTTNFAPGKGGVERDPSTIPTHFQFGSRDSLFLASAVEMKVQNMISGNKLKIKVEIENVGAGHHVPTDQPMRNMILIVTAKNMNGKMLNYIGKNFIPVWGGRGEVSDGNYEGLPGKGYAKILFENWTPYLPVYVNNRGQQLYPAPQWRTIKIKEDNRIPALQSDVSDYEFDMSDHRGELIVECKLIYRRIFKNWADMKKFDLEDIILSHKIKRLNIR